MSSFVHTQFPAEHPGVIRSEAVAHAASVALHSTARSFKSGRGLATLLLAAIVSALMVVANQLIDTWSDGHLLAAWVGLWTVAFAALALLAEPSKSAAASIRTRYAAWRETARIARQDEKFWNAALGDARIMADISRAMDESARVDSRRLAGFY